MAHPIPELTLEYPEWEQQDDETSKQKEAFDCFCVHGGSIRHCAKDLQEVQQGSIFHGLTLKYKPYSEHYYRRLANAHKFLERRELKDAYELEYRNKKFDEIDRKTDIDRYQKADDAEVATGELLEAKLANGEINGTQTKDFVTALNGYQDYKKKLRGEDSTKLEIDSKVDAKAEVKTDLENDIEKFQEKIMSGNLSSRTNEKLNKMLQGK